MKTVDIVLPVYNEAKTLETSIAKLVLFLQSQFNYDWRLIIAENGSFDNTLELAEKISGKYKEKLWVMSSKVKGRGRALVTAWEASDADIISYMDVDLSTDIRSFPLLVEEILNGADIVVGNRLDKRSKVKRTLLRTILSVSYNLLIKLFFGTKSFSDAQCGFKAAKRNVALSLLKETKNREWFFDTEFLVLAERKGYLVKEIPVSWQQGEKSKVELLSTIIEDLKEMVRLRWQE